MQQKSQQVQHSLISGEGWASIKIAIADAINELVLIGVGISLAGFYPPETGGVFLSVVVLYRRSSKCVCTAFAGINPSYISNVTLPVITTLVGPTCPRSVQVVPSSLIETSGVARSKCKCYGQ